MKTYGFKINGHDYKVEIDSIEGNIAKVNVNGKDYEVLMDEEVPAAKAAPEAAAPAAAVQAAAPAAPKADVPAGEGKAVTSPLPGVILEVSVAKGDKVKAGQKVAVLEAMKMENDIEADCDGIVTKVLVSKGDSVLEGAQIVLIG